MFQKHIVSKYTHMEKIVLPMCPEVRVHMHTHICAQQTHAICLYVISKHLVYRSLCMENERYCSKFFPLGYLFFPTVFQASLRATVTLKRFMFLIYHGERSLNQTTLICPPPLLISHWKLLMKSHNYELTDSWTHLKMEG